jgi:uncharacterized protein
VTTSRVLWMKDDPLGMEHAQVDIGADGMVATSTALGTTPLPYRLDLELRVGADWVTRRLALTARGDGWTRSLVLERETAWTGVVNDDGTVPPAVVASAPTDAVAPATIPPDVLDVDIQYSPLTNLMPIRRLGLDRPGATGAFVMAWVSVPSLAVTLDPQRYTVLGIDDGDRCARFENGDGFFTAVIRCDADGLVVDYPGIARRLTPSGDWRQG